MCVYLMYFLVSHLQFNRVHLSVVIPSASDDAVNLIAVSTNRWPLKLFGLNRLMLKHGEAPCVHLINACSYIYIFFLSAVTLFMGSIQETNSYGSPPTSLLPGSPLFFIL